MTSIDNYAFSGCSSLTSVIIPNSVTSIGDAAFSGCERLTSVTIPNSVTSIGWSTFSGCRSLTTITIPNSVTIIECGAFSSCSSLTTITIPNSVTKIEGGVFGGAFQNCSSLTTISIGSGVTKIDGAAFKDCLELTDVYCYAESVPQTSSDAFDGSFIEYATLHVPDASVYRGVSPWSSFGSIMSFAVDEALLERYFNLLADAKAALAEMQPSSSVELIQSVSQLSSPYTESAEGSLAALLDGNTNTFWHSNWRNGSVEGGIHYLQVDLINSTDMDVYATFTRRPTSSDHVTNMSVYGTNNPNAGKTACEELLTFDCPYTSNTEAITSPTFNTKGYRYLRFYANATTSNRGYWHISEFQLYSIPSNSLTYYMDGEDKNLQAVIDAQKGLARYQIGEAEYNALKAAYDAFMAKLAEVIDGIEDQKDTNDLEEAWFALDGKKLAKPQKGLNIIRYSNGSSRKVLIK